MAEKKGCGCSRCDMVEALMDFGNLTREAAEKKVDESLKKKAAKEEPDE